MPFRINFPPWFMPAWTMRRIRSNYHTLQLLKTRPKLRKAIISSCDKELVNTVSECVLNVLTGNLKLADRHKHRLQKGQPRSVVGRRVPLTAKRLINQRGGFLIPLLSAILPTLATLIFRLWDDVAQNVSRLTGIHEQEQTAVLPLFVCRN